MLQAMYRSTALRVALAVILVLSVVEIALRLGNYPIQRAGWVGEAVPPERRNQFGYHGRLIDYGPDDYVVILLGDSQAACQRCPRENHPEVILESLLKTKIPNARVYTLAAPGYGFDQALLALRSYLKSHRADLVIHWQTFTNDVWNNVFPTHMAPNNAPIDGTPKPTFVLFGATLWGPFWNIGDPVFPSRLMQFMWAQIRHYGIGLDWLWNIFLPAAAAPLTVDQLDPLLPRMTEPLGNPPFNGEKGTWAVHIDPASPRLEYAKRLWRRLLDEMKFEAESKGAKFVTFGEDRSLSSPTQKTFRLDTDGPFYLRTKEGYYLRAGMQIAAQRQAEWSQGFNFFMLPITAENPYVSESDLHLNDRANRQVLTDLIAGMAAKGYLAR